MIGYNPSHLNKNETLLEAFHRVEAYLKANPQYQVYQSSAQYQEGTQEYALGTIVVPEGSNVGAGDVVLFSNVYYAVITSVSETTFSIETATNFRGTDGTNGKDGVTPNISVSATVDNSEGTPSVEVTKSGTNENPSFAFDFHNIKGATGATGAPGPTGPTGVTPNITMTADVVGTTGEPYVDVFKGETPPEQPTYSFVFHNLKGETGAPGPTGENGKDGSNGKDGNATYLSVVSITKNTAAITRDAITSFPGRPVIFNDIIISTAIDTFGAMARVTGTGDDVVTVEFIGTLKSDGSGVSDYNQLNNIPVINQDLIVSGFTPVANTYYRHTGATNNTFTQGVIYLYDTAYHKLGESGGGGTTLNHYTYNVPSLDRLSRTETYRIANIISKAKFISQISAFNSTFSKTVCYKEGAIPNADQSSVFTMKFDNISADNNFEYLSLIISLSSDKRANFQVTTFSNGNFVTTSKNELIMKISYYNDTEIL